MNMVTRPVSRWLRTAVSPTAAVWIVMSLLACAAAFGAISLSGTKTGVALALLAVLGPLALYLSITMPMIFPFCAFILLIPFDNLLAMSAFGTLTRLGAIVSGAAMMAWLLRTQKLAVPDRTVMWWGAFVLWCVASLMWAIDPTMSLTELPTLIQLYLLYVIASFMPVSRRTVTILIALLIVSGAFAAAYGAYIFHSGTDVTAAGRLVLATDSNKIDPNKFAAALVAPFALALIAFVSSKPWTLRILSAACVSLLGAGVALSGSRGGLLAIGVAFVYLIFHSRRRLLIAGVGVFGMAAALSLYGNILGRFSSAASSGGAGRYDIWKVGFAAFREHFLYGAGYANFSLAFDQSFLSVSQRYYTHWHRAPHSIIVSTATELGIIGLALFLGAWWVQLRSLRNLGFGDAFYGVRIGLEAAVLGLFFSGLFLDIMGAKFLWIVFILIALVRNAALSARRSPVEIHVSPILPPYAARAGN